MDYIVGLKRGQVTIDALQPGFKYHVTLSQKVI